MLPPLERWLETVVRPAAIAAYGLDVRQMSVASAYSCRQIAGSSNMSEPFS